MMPINHRKIDRRTLYTIQVIKDALLQLLAQEPYSQITVAKICRTAEITRTTFYLHFDNLTAVLNTLLEDALNFNDLPINGESYIPACQRISKNNAYRALFMDPSLSDYIIGRIYTHEQAVMIPKIIQKTKVSPEDADLLFRYTLRGSFYVNYCHHWQRTKAWQHDVDLLNFMLEHGYQSLLSREKD